MNAGLAQFAQDLHRLVEQMSEYGGGWQIILPPKPSSNARVLVSRNKREGGYAGRIAAAYRWYRRSTGSSGHVRAGGGQWRKESALRDWSRP